MNEAPSTDEAPRQGAESVAKRLHGRSVAVAESCTAGRVSAALASVELASQFFCGAVTAYQEQVKRTLLGVEAESVFSEQAAVEMARGIVGLLGADVAVATTGVAGSEAVDGVEPGTVFVATLVDGVVRTTTLDLAGDPDEICDAAAQWALGLLATHLSDPATAPAVDRGEPGVSTSGG